MTNLLSYIDLLLLAVLPYVSMTIFLLGTIERYRTQSFSYSSLSSQFLENRRHFWGNVPFHYGILVVLTGHVVAFLIPRQLLWWNRVPVRVYVLEVSALAFGLLCVAGLLLIVARRLYDPKVKVVTSPADWVVYGLLLLEVVSGVLVAVVHPWGSSWFATAVTPYLWSLVTMRPDAAAVAAMPLLVKLHIVNAYLLIGFVPFSRLVHVLVVPNPYLWRKPQV
ncbi:MAG: respiratory nitrate reductase subunit gamma, partial [Acidobacteria bacterium]|nr:respiratory nitrate reductase subunit gamma [Acidobacteriota bacterium]